jgi:hypothetical protein
MKSWHEETKTFPVDVEVVDLEANPEGKETVAEQQDVPKEEATVKTVRALKKQYEHWHLSIGCC